MQLCPKEKHRVIKTIIAVLVMVFVMYLSAELSVRWYNFCISIIKDAMKLPLLLKILIILFCGSSIPGMLLGAPIYGTVITIDLSNKIIISKKGLRYIIFGLLWVLLYGLNIIASITLNEFNSAEVIPFLFGIFLVLWAKRHKI